MSNISITNVLNNITPKQPIKLIFSHSRGGGTEFFLQEHLLDNDLIILIRGIGPSSTDNVQIICNKKIINTYTFTDIHELFNVLHLINITMVDINHVISLDDLDASLKHITKYIIDNKLQARFYLHDYFSLCPTVNLINNKGRYCGLPTDENICNQCLMTNKQFLNYDLPPGVLIKKWREPFLALLQACSEIFVFSDSSNKLLLKCYPELAKHVQRYKLNRDIMPKIVNKIDFSDKKIINVGVLGLIQATKGLGKLEELAKFIEILALPIQLTIVGAATEIVENVQITGEYSRDDLPKIVSSSNIDLFVIPSICPETYCYTADEIIQMGYPLICFDVGAPPERLNQYKHGYVAKEINSYNLLEKIIEVSGIYNFKYFEMMDEAFIRDKLINFINETNKKNTKLLHYQKVEIHTKSQELDNKSKLLHLKEIELQKTANELRTLLNSNSWKLMAPFRLASKTVKRLSLYKLFRIKYYMIEGIKNPSIIINKLKNILQSVRRNKLIRLNIKRRVPVISVIIPIYDRTETLKESIDSILRQTYKNFELILVCDGSPKETLKIVKSYEMNPLVRIFYFNNNSGNAVRGRNKAIKEALGQYLAFQDSDDIAVPTRLEKSLFYMEKYKVDVVYGGWKALIEDRDIDLANGQEVFSPDCDFNLLKEICVPCQSTVMARLTALRDVGGLKPLMRYREDHELWLRLAYFGYKFKSIPHILISLRLHGNNLELAHKDNDLKWQNLMLETYTKKNKPKPKIGYILPDGGIGGGVAVVCNHANYLLERGYDISIYLEDNSNQINWFPNQKINVFGVNQIPDNLDILVATHWTTVYTARKVPAKEKYYFIQSDERRFYPEFSETYYKVKETYEAEDFKFITMARWMQAWLEKEFQKSAVYVPNGINLELFKNLENKYPTNRVRVLIEGPIDIPFKGMDDAFRVVKDLDCEVWCVSSSGELKKEWRCDRFFKKVPMNEMPAIYSSCDILLKMSRVESFCYPPLEMMACGGTVVIGKVTGIDEYIKNGYNALVIETGDIEGAKVAINKLISNTELRKELIAKGEETAKMWMWNKSIDELESIFYVNR